MAEDPDLNNQITQVAEERFAWEAEHPQEKGETSQ
jgi:hypothetical protein